MLSHEGLWVLLPLVLPAIAYLVPVKLRGNLAAWLTAVALLVFCPGYIATDNTQALRDDEGRANAILDRIPAGRWGTGDDVAGTAVFLASRASDYVSGVILPVDGGWLGR